MDAIDIGHRWEARTLTHEDIYRYLNEQVVPMDPLLSHSSIVTAADICLELYEWAIGKIGSGCLDGLSDAIVRNDLDRAMGCCDLNMRHGGLWIVSVFLYNCAPRGWNKKIKKED